LLIETILLSGYFFKAKENYLQMSRTLHATLNLKLIEKKTLEGEIDSLKSKTQRQIKSFFLHNLKISAFAIKIGERGCQKFNF
jgi:hypothetical protein